VLLGGAVMEKNKIEILSPAGSYDTFVSAVKSGADAVYMGGRCFNARKNAVNFSDEEIISAVRFAHLHSVKVYVTLNTLVSDSELGEVYDFIEFLYNAGVDALIIQDLAILGIVKKYFPDFEVHASTQMTVCNLEGASLAKEMGFKRVVLSRELTFDEIKTISENVDIELEVFVHGALCMSYSGQCLMSSFIGSRSGNRGACAQPCRLPYTLCNAQGKQISESKKYLLSLKDLCLVEEIEKLSSIGVKSLKIEGRMKSSDYVSIVTSTYNKYRHGGKVDKEDIDKLKNIFSRSGFTKGYFEGNTGRHMLNYDKNNDDVYVNIADGVKKEAQLIKDSSLPKILFDAHIKLSLCESAALTVSAMGSEVTVTGTQKCEKAINVPLTKDRIISQMSKTGATEFELGNIDIDMDEGISLPIKEINELRRIALEKLTDSIIAISRQGKTGALVLPEASKFSYDNKFLARILSTEQAKAAVDAGFDKILVPYSLYAKNKEYFDNMETDISVILPPISKDSRLIDWGIIKGEVYATNISHLFMADKLNMRADFTLNTFNSLAIEELKNKGIKSVCFSVEANLKEISKLKPTLPMEFVVYGKIPLMTVQNCIVKSSLGKCGCDDSIYYLKDRKDMSFPVKADKLTCTNTIYNATPLYMSDKLDEIPDCSAVHFIFTDEKPDEIKRIFSSYKTNAKPLNDFTRGHYYRGV
jgi:putative protease